MSVMHTDPVLSCEESLEFERNHFKGDGNSVVNDQGGSRGRDALLRDMQLRTIPHRPRLLVLVGKGLEEIQ